jgi:hypothetical protein
VSVELAEPATVGGLPTRRRRLVVAGGVLSALNGASHLVLPLLYPWGSHTEDLYAPVRWALYAGTMFFGLLLLWGGVLVIALARRDDVPAGVRRVVFGGLAGFWVVGAAYEIAVPFPAPVANWLLPVFSLVVAALLAAGLATGRRG